MSLTDFAPDAHRLAMELECLLLDCTDTRAVSKWWDSANEALDQHRAFCATIEAEATKPCVCGEPATPGVVHRTDGPCYLQEATKPQEPIGYDDIFNAIAEAASPCGGGIGVSVMVFKRVIGGEIYTTPQHCPKCAEGMVSVAKEDANNYCRILTLLGMEEEGSPVEAVERLISLRDGMTCGDCNDTGWLENREEGRYPCTCMTEAEPYQILQAKITKQVAEIERLKTVPMKYRRMAFNAQLQEESRSQAERIKVLEEDVTHYKSEAHDAGMSRVQIGKLQDKIEKLNSKLQIDNTIIGDFDARCKELELKIAKLKTPPVIPHWVRVLELEVRMSSMNHTFTFSRDKTLELMGISMEIQAAFHALKTENESLVPIKEALAKAKLALDSCDVNDTQFPLDTQYYDRELVDEAISIIDKLPK